MPVLLWTLHRLSAVLLAVLVSVHLVTMILAINGGLSAGEMRLRTEGNVLWAAIYSLFVLAAATHGVIGLRNVCLEWLPWAWTPWRRASLNIAAILLFSAMLILGMLAVAGLF